MRVETLVVQKLICNVLYYDGTPVLKYTLKYPEICSTKFCETAEQLNKYYNTKVILYQKYRIRELYNLAVEDYQNSIEEEYPFRMYEVYMENTITYNKDCILSMYFDKYEYTGGAHGMTIREGDTWNLSNGERVTLEELYVGDEDLKEYMTSYIIAHIKEEIEAGNDYYFENYEELVKENFNSRNFYLTKEGVVIFYQHYDIAPYSSGIMTFTIPFRSCLDGVIQLPKCC